MTPRRPIESSLSATEALLTLRDDERPVALVGAWAGGGAILTSDPVRTASPEDDPFALLDDVPTAAGGWFGVLGYRLGGAVERLPPSPPQPVPVPAFSLACYDHVLRLDAAGRWWFEGVNDDRYELLAERLAAPAPSPRPFRCGAFETRPGAAGHRAAVKECVERIAAGDLYQANLTMRLEAEFDGEAIDLFAHCAERLKPMYGAYVGDHQHQVVSLSPELFLERRARTLRTAPIKGTIAREGDGPERLAESAKDRAENVMIVDLMRNDLGRVCEFGSVTVPALARAEAHPGVWHLVSDVHGTLLPEVGDGDLLRATFPPGSVTGAPKIKAMEVIAQLESTAREAYTGAIGHASRSGLELNVAIRTFEVAGGRVWLGAGGGVTADSTPRAEHEECLVKARPLLAAAGARLATAPAPSAAPVPPPTRAPRPDPARGIFETLLVTEGRAHDLEAHWARLLASAAALYGLRPQLPALERLPDAPHRLRLTLLPAGDLRTELSPATVLPTDPATLTPITIPGGLGAHKWLDRRVLGAVPGEALIVDLDGSVLESGHGNVFVVEDGALLTPPADGRILPGVTRAALLAHAREERITLDRLRAADEVFLTSSIRLLQPVVPGPVARRFADRLAVRPLAAQS